MDVSLQERAKLLKAVADENRLQIIDLLKSGEKCACVLLEDLALSQSGLSYHMKLLCEANLVTPREEGKWTHYKINKAGWEKLISLLDKVIE